MKPLASSNGFTYRCPLDCPFRKRCFIIKVAEELKSPLTVLHKCCVIKRDISITIGDNSTD
ncbi:MAG: hypothetical protein Q4F00_10590 [bacterium]|nr:hypothetical protein [bacterium]